MYPFRAPGDACAPRFDAADSSALGAGPLNAFAAIVDPGPTSTWWPAVSATMSSDSRMGTPERTSAERVRENRASAVLRTSLPKIGSFSLIASHCLRPSSELIQRRNANAPPPSATKITYQNLRQTFEMLISNWVGAGSVPPNCE